MDRIGNRGKMVKYGQKGPTRAPRALNFFFFFFKYAPQKMTCRFPAVVVAGIDHRGKTKCRFVFC